ncbi:MAG: diguanylate cyclase [Actinomycetota bacterium]
MSVAHEATTARGEPFTISLAALRQGDHGDETDWLDVDTLTMTAGEIAIETAARAWPAVVLNGRDADALVHVSELRDVAPAVRVIATVDDVATGAQLLRAGARRIVPAGRWDLLVGAVREELLNEIEAREIAAARREIDSARAVTAKILRDSEDLLVVIGEEDVVVWASPAATMALGLDEGDDYLERVHPDDTESAATAIQEADRTVELRLGSLEGGWRKIQATFVDQRDDADVGGVVVSQRDITDEHDATEVLRHQATHDPLTDLPTRTLMMDLLGRSLDRMRRGAGRVGVCYVDLDGFKAVNDRLGHDAGDELLVAVSARLGETVRATDVVARVGGDEFVVILDGVKGEEEAVAIGAKLVDAVAVPWALSAGQATIGVSVGIAMAASPEHDPNHLLADADAAMYHVKASGKGAVQLYSDLVRSVADDREDLRQRLGHALESDEIGCLYAPMVSLGSGEVHGFLGDLQWTHPERGQLPASEWLMLAEDVGLGERIEDRVLMGAVELHDRWRRAGHQGTTIWLPVARRQLMQARFARRAIEVAEQHGLTHRPIGFRISEASVAKQPVELGEVMARLTEHGYRFGLDGYRGVGIGPDVLQDLPIDSVFLDGHFARRLGSDNRAARALVGIVSMSRHLGLDVVATEVDNHTHLAFVLQLMCPRATGALFAHPQAPEHTAAMLRPGYTWNVPLGGAGPAASADDQGIEATTIAGLGSPAIREG